jgi:hypothetical protein
VSAPEKESADWLSIVLFFAFGFVVGCATTFLGLQRSGAIYRYPDNHIYIFLGGGAAVSGALAALFGDRFFYRSNSIIPPMPIEHTKASRSVLWVIVACGVGVPVLLRFL